MASTPASTTWRGQRLAGKHAAVGGPHRREPHADLFVRGGGAIQPHPPRGTRRWHGSFARDSFGWVAPPVLNPYTRIAVEMNPARGIIRAVGYELHAGEEFARPVTQPREFSAERAAA